MAKQVRTDFPWVADISGWQWQTTRHTHTRVWRFTAYRKGVQSLGLVVDHAYGHPPPTVGLYTDDQSEGAARSHVARVRTAA